MQTERSYWLVVEHDDHGGLTSVSEDFAEPALPVASEASSEKTADSEDGERTPGKLSDHSFAAVQEDFVLEMRSYAAFYKSFMSAIPLAARNIAASTLRKFCEEYGELVSGSEKEKKQVFKFPMTTYSQLSSTRDQFTATIISARKLPPIMVIGMLSSWDAFVGRLIKAAIIQRPETVLNRKKEVLYSEILKFSSIDDLREHLIDSEVEGVLRESHQFHFDYIQKTFDVKTRDGLECWSVFMELCQRRHLFTHTGGFVSAQYIKMCQSQMIDTGNIKAGDKLDVTPAYFEQALDTLYEIGIKLSYVLWRKLGGAKSRGPADSALNDIGFRLVRDRHYEVAENVLKFGQDVLRKQKGEERTRRMMVINWANSVRLQDNKKEAKRILDLEDWSAVSPDFMISLAAVREDVSLVCSLMREGGNNGAVKKGDYRGWPVFRGLREKPQFQETFREIFGEEVYRNRRLDLTPEAIDRDDAKGQTKH